MHEVHPSTSSTNNVAVLSAETPKPPRRSSRRPACIAPTAVEPKVVWNCNSPEAVAALKPDTCIAPGELSDITIAAENHEINDLLSFTPPLVKIWFQERTQQKSTVNASTGSRLSLLHELNGTFRRRQLACEKFGQELDECCKPTSSHGRSMDRDFLLQLASVIGVKQEACSSPLATKLRSSSPHVRNGHLCKKPGASPINLTAASPDDSGWSDQSSFDDAAFAAASQIIEDKLSAGSTSPGRHAGPLLLEQTANTAAVSPPAASQSLSTAVQGLGADTGLSHTVSQLGAVNEGATTHLDEAKGNSYVRRYEGESALCNRQYVTRQRLSSAVKVHTNHCAVPLTSSLDSVAIQSYNFAERSLATSVNVKPTVACQFSQDTAAKLRPTHTDTKVAAAAHLGTNVGSLLAQPDPRMVAAAQPCQSAVRSIGAVVEGTKQPELKRLSGSPPADLTERSAKKRQLATRAVESQRTTRRSPVVTVAERPNVLHAPVLGERTEQTPEDCRRRRQLCLPLSSGGESDAESVTTVSAGTLSSGCGSDGRGAYTRSASSGSSVDIGAIQYQTQEIKPENGHGHCVKDLRANSKRLPAVCPVPTRTHIVSSAPLPLHSVSSETRHCVLRQQASERKASSSFTQQIDTNIARVPQQAVMRTSQPAVSDQCRTAAPASVVALCCPATVPAPVVKHSASFTSQSKANDQQRDAAKFPTDGAQLLQATKVVNLWDARHRSNAVLKKCPSSRCDSSLTAGCQSGASKKCVVTSSTSNSASNLQTFGGAGASSRCSPEEIARKRKEALERKMKKVDSGGKV